MWARSPRGRQRVLSLKIQCGLLALELHQLQSRNRIVTIIGPEPLPSPPLCLLVTLTNQTSVAFCKLNAMRRETFI